MQRMIAFYPGNTKLVEEVKSVAAYHEQKKAELAELKQGLEKVAGDASERSTTEVCHRISFKLASIVLNVTLAHPRPQPLLTLTHVFHGATPLSPSL
jgi:hypothetical protein